jgi:phage host-nuclease inhibitor protein Gam
MAKRTKPQPPQITSRAEADEAMEKIAQHQCQLDGIDACMNENINAAKTAAKLHAAPLQIAMKTLGDSLGAYATYNKAELFEKNKTIEANHGRYGFRKSSTLKPLTKLNWKDVLDKLKALKRDDMVRAKEDVDKDALRKLPEAEMEALGVRLVKTDDFWFEIKQEEVEDVA